MTHNRKILTGKTIILTYPQSDDDDCFDMITAAGAQVCLMPVIEIRPLPFTLGESIESYRWLVFTGKSAFAPFFESHRPTAANRIAVLGPGTARALERHGYKACFTGSGRSAVHFAKELATVIPPEERILFVSGALAPRLLEAELTPRYRVDRVDVYQTVMPTHIDTDVLDMVKRNNYHVLVVTSPSAVNNLLQLVPGNTSLRIVSIGETTTAAAIKNGVQPVMTAVRPGYKELAEAILKAVANKLEL